MAVGGLGMGGAVRLKLRQWLSCELLDIVVGIAKNDMAGRRGRRSLSDIPG